MSSFTYKMKLVDFLRLIDTDTHVEVYEGDTSVTGMVYEGMNGKLQERLQQEDTWDQYSNMIVQPEGVSIDPPGVLCILMDSE